MDGRDPSCADMICAFCTKTRDGTGISVKWNFKLFCATSDTYACYAKRREPWVGLNSVHIRFGGFDVSFIQVGRASATEFWSLAILSPFRHVFSPISIVPHTPAN